MKILLVCESPRMPTGFGQQARIIAEGLADRGHEIVCYSYAAEAREPLRADIQEICAPIGDLVTQLERTAERVRPDCVVVLRDMFTLTCIVGCRSLWPNVPVRCWLAYEGDAVSPQLAKAFEGVPEQTIVHMSQYAAAMWRDFVTTDAVIYHAVDDSIFKPLGNVTPRELRKKWSSVFNSYISPTAKVVLCTERNDYRKRWDSVFEICQKLVAKGHDVQLLAHTLMRAGENDTTIRYDLETLANLYNMRGRLINSQFKWHAGMTREEMNELYNLCDVRISASAAEGFGLGAIEASAAMTPQVVNDYSCAQELFPAGSRSVVPDCGRYFVHGTIWRTPNTEMMANRVAEFLNGPTSDAETSKEVVANYNYTLSTFSKKTIVDQWEAVIKDSKPSRHLIDGLDRPHQRYAYYRLLLAYVRTLMTDPKLYIIATCEEDWGLVRVAQRSGMRFRAVRAGSDPPFDLAAIEYVDIDSPFDADVILTGLHPILSSSDMLHIADKAIYTVFSEQGLVLWGSPESSGQVLAKVLTSENWFRRKDLDSLRAGDDKWKHLHHVVYQSQTKTGGSVLPIPGGRDAASEPEF